MKQINVFFGNETNRTVYSAHTGLYRIECWGGQGALHGGKGGYVSGDIFFRHPVKLHLFVGDQGKNGTEGKVFNNGGVTQYQGGGASDVRLVNDDTDEFKSLKSRIIVAGGGGGSDSKPDYVDASGRDTGGDAGGIEGYPSNFNYGMPGNQEAGGVGNCSGSFGKGGGNGFIDGNGNGGGGGGYFGGGGSNISTNGGGGGGSSYISGHNGCLAIDYSSINQSYYSMRNDSIHYSGFSFFNTVMLDGKSEMPSPFEKGNETGHSSFGVIRITILCITNTYRLRMDMRLFIMLASIYKYK